MLGEPVVHDGSAIALRARVRVLFEARALIPTSP